MILKERKETGVIIDTTKGEQTVTLVAGIDAGSTETRVSLVNQSDFEELLNPTSAEKTLEVIDSMYVIPSTFAVLEDNREVLPKSVNLNDNYDSTISSVSIEAEKPYIQKHRIIRGQKIKDAVGSVERFLDSSTPKTSNQIFYISVLDSIGYGILQKYSGNIPNSVDLYLCLSVRPNELGVKFKKELMDNLKGTFHFTWNNNKENKISLEINILLINLTTEPEAQIEGSTAMYDLIVDALSNKETPLTPEEHAQLQEATNVSEILYEAVPHLHMEGGGSSIGTEYVQIDDQGSPVLMSACSRTFNIGGNYVMRTLKDKLREYKGRLVSDSTAYTALVTGYIKNGRQQDDVLDYVKEVKETIARIIFEKLMHEVIDVNSDIVLTEVGYISMSGRLFSKGENGISIADYFSNLIHEVSPNTTVIRLPRNFIPQGNALRLLNTYEVFSENNENENK